MKKMKITISRSGQVSIAVEGAVGPECLEFTKAMEQSVGVVENRVLTDAYHEENVALTASVNVNESAL